MTHLEQIAPQHWRDLADVAIETGAVVQDDDVAAMPDIVAADEYFAKGLLPPPPAALLVRPDGRCCGFYLAPDGQVGR